MTPQLSLPADVREALGSEPERRVLEALPFSWQPRTR